MTDSRFTLITTSARENENDKYEGFRGGYDDWVRAEPRPTGGKGGGGNFSGTANF
jgi:hypothetical protein